MGVLEIAEIDVVEGREDEFERAVARAVPLFERARGCTGLDLHRSIENPSRYRLVVSWDAVEDHTVGFRGSEDFTAWRALVGEFFASPPRVEHTTRVLAGF